MPNPKSPLLDYLVQWIDSMSPQELERKIRANESLVEEVKPHEAKMKIGKMLFKLDVDANLIIDHLLAYRPVQGQILFLNKQWYDKQIEELTAYIDRL